MDEPLSNLDAKLRVQMRTEITKLHQRLQTTFIYVTHDQTEAMTMGDRIVVMKDGFIQQVDTPQNLYRLSHATCSWPASSASPQMNFFDVKLEQARRGRVSLCSATTSSRCPNGKVQKLIDRELHRQGSQHGYPSREHPRRSRLFLQISPTPSSTLTSKLIELMGSETYLYLKTTGKDDQLHRPCRSSLPPAAPATRIKIAFDANRLHFFDVDTEASILNR